MTFTTADLYDANEGKVQVLSLILQSYGNKRRFSGHISTIRCHEDNTLVRAALEEPGEGRVLVIDGGGSVRCALVGDNLAQLAQENGWQGIVLNGCIRDSAVINELDTGIKALGTNPKKSVKKGIGERDIPVSFGAVDFVPGSWLYADEDGVLLSEKQLTIST
ncbi:MAG: ribonuclease E activity regulator RraA [Gammaproteobacteria bacterium]